MIVIKCRLHRNRDKYYKFFCWGGGGCEARSGIQLNVKSVKIYRGTENLGLNRYFNSINTTCAVQHCEMLSSSIFFQGMQL